MPGATELLHSPPEVPNCCAAMVVSRCQLLWMLSDLRSGPSSNNQVWGTWLPSLWGTCHVQ